MFARVVIARSFTYVDAEEHASFDTHRDDSASKLRHTAILVQSTGQLAGETGRTAETAQTY